VEERKKRRKLTPEAALEQMRSYCAYQERCHKEVRTRLLEYQVYGEDLEGIISDLISEGFLNEERFAKAYARGKSRMKNWGRIKITQELKFRQISPYCIKKGLAEIDPEEYYTGLVNFLIKKNRLIRESNPFKRKQKLNAFAMRRGFEYDIIKEAVAEALEHKE